MKGKERIKEIPRIERFVGRPPLKEIFGEIKTKSLEIKGMYAAHVQYGYTLKEIGDFLGIHYSTVSKLLKEVRGEK